MSQKCATMPLKISSLIDRELGELEARRVRAHVESCVRCAAAYREMRSARHSARMIRQHEIPSDFWNSVCNGFDRVDRHGPAAKLGVRQAARGLRWPLRVRVLAAVLLGLAVPGAAVTIHHWFVAPEAGSSAVPAAAAEPGRGAAPATAAVRPDAHPAGSPAPPQPVRSPHPASTTPAASPLGKSTPITGLNPVRIKG